MMVSVNSPQTLQVRAQAIVYIYCRNTIIIIVLQKQIFDSKPFKKIAGTLLPPKSRKVFHPGRFGQEKRGIERGFPSVLMVDFVEFLQTIRTPRHVSLSRANASKQTQIRHVARHVNRPRGYTSSSSTEFVVACDIGHQHGHGNVFAVEVLVDKVFDLFGVSSVVRIQGKIALVQKTGFGENNVESVAPKDHGPGMVD